MTMFTFLSAGESHGPHLTIIVTGMPAGVRLDRARINRDLARRQHGYGRGGRMKIEHDEVEIAGGLRAGETLGSPIAIVVRNLDYENWRGVMDPWEVDAAEADRKSTRLNSSHSQISYAVFCLKKKNELRDRVLHFHAIH